MSKLKFIVLTSGWDGMPIAYHLQQEGYNVTVGQVQDKDELQNNEPKEDPEERADRLSQYDGMLKKIPASKLVDALKKVDNKDDYFIFCDQNSLWYYSEQLLSAGFKHGLFPTRQNYLFEKNREEAMTFVEKHYAGIKLIPYHEFKSVDDAKSFINDNQGAYVLQSKGDFCSTVVPTSNDEKLASEQIINQLETNRAKYEKGGIILKTKLIDPVEVTPQIVFYNGEPVFTDIDIETKNIGDGNNNGNQVGCGSNLIVATNIDEKINTLAFPKIIYDMAKEHAGMFVWDISLYITNDGIFFGEFCPNRLGYDAVMTEMTMANGAGKYFESIIAGKNPLEDKFGVAVRLFNLMKYKNVQVLFNDIKENVWLYDVKNKDSDIVSVGSDWDLGVLTASGNSLIDTIEELYEQKSEFVFKELYTRTLSDFKDIYPTSIMTRFKEINHKYIEAPDADKFDKFYANKLKSEIDYINKKKNDEIDALRSEIADILKEE